MKQVESLENESPRADSSWLPGGSRLKNNCVYRLGEGPGDEADSKRPQKRPWDEVASEQFKMAPDEKRGFCLFSGASLFYV